MRKEIAKLSSRRIEKPMRRSAACTNIRVRNILNPISSYLTPGEVFVNALIDCMACVAVIALAVIFVALQVSA